MADRKFKTATIILDTDLHEIEGYEDNDELDARIRHDLRDYEMAGHPIEITISDVVEVQARQVEEGELV